MELYKLVADFTARSDLTNAQIDFLLKLLNDIEKEERQKFDDVADVLDNLSKNIYDTREKLLINQSYLLNLPYRPKVNLADATIAAEMLRKAALSSD